MTSFLFGRDNGKNMKFYGIDFTCFETRTTTCIEVLHLNASKLNKRRGCLLEEIQYIF